MKKIIYMFFIVFSVFLSNCFASELTDDELYKKYKKVTEDINLIKAIEMLDSTTGSYSKEAILGKNLTEKPIKVEFLNLSTINPEDRQSMTTGTGCSSLRRAP